MLKPSSGEVKAHSLIWFRACVTSTYCLRLLPYSELSLFQFLGHSLASPSVIVVICSLASQSLSTHCAFCLLPLYSCNSGKGAV